MSAMTFAKVERGAAGVLGDSGEVRSRVARRECRRAGPGPEVRAADVLPRADRRLVQAWGADLEVRQGGAPVIFWVTVRYVEPTYAAREGGRSAPYRWTFEIDAADAVGALEDAQARFRQMATLSSVGWVREIVAWEVGTAPPRRAQNVEEPVSNQPEPGDVVVFVEDVLEHPLLEVAVPAGTSCVVVREHVVRGRALGLEMTTGAGASFLVDDVVVYDRREDGTFRARGRFSDLPILARWVREGGCSERGPSR